MSAFHAKANPLSHVTFPLATFFLTQSLGALSANPLSPGKEFCDWKQLGPCLGALHSQLLNKAIFLILTTSNLEWMRKRPLLSLHANKSMSTQNDDCVKVWLIVKVG